MKNKILSKAVLTFETDIEGNNNRGWQVDRITLADGDDIIGYIKIAYIPKQRFVDYYPTIFNWLDQIKGNFLFPRDTSMDSEEWRLTPTRHYNTFKKAELRDFVSKLNNLGIEIANPDTALKKELLDAVKKLEKDLLNSKLGVQFKEFKTHLVDKPIDDFVRVEPAYQRNGIAEYLYAQGAKWMESRKLPFYLSTTRTVVAQALAEKMRSNGWLRKMSNKRERFVPDKIDV